MDSHRTYDLVVVGAGPAGVASATTAARRGAKVALVEKYPFFGGQATAAHVGTICGLYSHGTQSRELIGSFANEYVDRLQASSRLQPITNKHGLSYLPYESDVFASVADQLLVESSVDVFLSSTCCGVDAHEKRLQSLRVLCFNEMMTLSATTFVDATGEGILARFLGVSLIEDESYQAPGFVFALSNLGEELQNFSEQELNLILHKELASSGPTSLLEKEYRLSVVPGSFYGSSCLLKLAVPFVRSGKFNEVTQIERTCRCLARDSLSYLKEHCALFAGVRVLMSSTQVGLRSGPRAEGEAILAKTDIIAGCRVGDAVANGLWPVEMWTAARKPEIELLQGRECYQIGASNLVSKEIPNLLACGRGISATAGALSSARVIGTSLATGSASGVLAVGILNGEARDKSIAQYQSEEGVFS